MNNIEIELECNIGLTWPEYKFNYPFTFTEHCINETVKQHIVRLKVGEPPLILIYNKSASETVSKDGIIVLDQTLKVNKIWVDDILLDPDNIQYDTTLYYPSYSKSFINYCAEHNITVDYGPLPGFQTFYHSGKWVFNFQLPFWKWYNDIRNQKILSTFTESDRELYFGAESNDHKNLLHQLKTLVNHV